MSCYDWPAAAALTGYVSCYVAVSIVGMHYGYPEVLWVWGVLFMTGFNPGCDCEGGDHV